ncbi:MAG: hypothetical protein U5J83_01225 [Bryobacterales bacterium]|nr:hypothetical protein [Bryobacterales bacterium]
MGRTRLLLFWLFFSVLAISLQWTRGALDGTWSGDPDEPAHFLNGVMLLDYAKSGLGEHPLRYAERYYAHYPRIGLGHWPPFFAIVEAAWFLVAPASYASGLVLLGLMAAAISTMLMWLCTRWFPPWIAFGSGIVWLLLPDVRTGTNAFKAEIPLTLLTLLAVVAYARASTAFGVWSGLAFLTKGSALGLAFLPLVDALLSRSWRIFRQRWLWVSAAIVVLMAGPWYAFAPYARHEKVRMLGGVIRRPLVRAATIPGSFWESLGPVLCILAFAGLFIFWSRFREDKTWRAMVVFLPGNLLLRTMVAVWEPRHFVVLMPELICLAALGFQFLIACVPAGWARGALAGVLAVGSTAPFVLWEPPRETVPGTAEAAQAIAQVSMIGGQAALVSGRAGAEGAVIVEFSLLDAKRPRHTIYRGSKLLADQDAMGRNYTSLLSGPDDTEAILAGRKVAAVAVDLLAPDQHTGTLLRHLRQSPEAWVPLGVFGDLAVFRRAP